MSMCSHLFSPSKLLCLCRGLDCHLFGKIPHLALRRVSSLNPGVTSEFVPAWGCPQQAESSHKKFKTLYRASHSRSSNDWSFGSVFMSLARLACRSAWTEGKRPCDASGRRACSRAYRQPSLPDTPQKIGAAKTGSLCPEPPLLRGRCCAGAANILHTAVGAAPGGWRFFEAVNAPEKTSTNL